MAKIDLEKQKIPARNLFFPELRDPERGGVLHGSPDAIVRKFMQVNLAKAEISESLLKGAGYYASAEVYIHLRVGDAQKQLERAEREIAKLGLDAEKKARARQMAKEQFSAFKWWIGGEEREGSLSVGAVETLEHQQKLAEAARKRALVASRAEFMRRRFVGLMALTDEKVRIMNIGKRVDLKQDPVYEHAGGRVRRMIEARTLSEEGYEWHLMLIDKAKKFKPKPRKTMEDLEEMRLKGELFPYAVGRLEKRIKGLSRDEPKRRKLGDSLFNRYIYYIEALVMGEMVLRSTVLEAGLNPEEVFRKAANIRVSVFADLREEGNTERVLLRRWRGIINKGVDPVAYEEGWMKPYR